MGQIADSGLVLAMLTDERQLVILPAQRVKIGRNAPCPCGSGKKYKKCCWAGD